jgi:phage-related protein
VQVPSLSAGDTLTLDVTRGTIILINGANPAPGIYKYDARQSGFLSQMFLNPGNNTVAITGAVSTGLSIQYRDAYA